MPKEKSVGAVVFRQVNGKPLFLLLHYTAGHWGFPKGHVEANETESQTMLRELEEETCLRVPEIARGFRQHTSYFFRRGSETVFKEVVFLLANSQKGEVCISHEHQGFEWLPFEKALERLSFKNTRHVLLEAKRFLEGETLS